MDIKIRECTIEDFPAILTLVKALAAFQGEPDHVHITLEQMIEDQKLIRCLVAVINNEVVAIATYYFAYYTWVGKSLYLDDLFVDPAYRSNKIGSMLLDELFNIADRNQCKRVRWQVSNWNKDAIVFYEKCGATINREVYNCDFDEAAIKQYNLTVSRKGMN